MRIISLGGAAGNRIQRNRVVRPSNDELVMASLFDELAAYIWKGRRS
jgi:hypothetical protein